jgi:hypothetical protein
MTFGGQFIVTAQSVLANFSLRIPINLGKAVQVLPPEAVEPHRDIHL